MEDVSNPQVPYYLSPNNQMPDPSTISVPVGPGGIEVNPLQQQAAQQVQAQQADVQMQQQAAQQQAVQPQVTPQQNYMQSEIANVEKQKAINTSLADAGVQKAKFDAEAQRELIKQQQDDIYNRQIKQAEMQNEVNGQLESLQNAQNEYKNFLASPEAKVKVNNLWENMGTGQKILAGISLVLGAAGAGTSGRNGAVEVITKAIDTDIAAQKQNIQLQAEGKLQNYNAENNMYGQMLKKYQNEDAALAATQLLKLQQVQSQLNAVAADYSGTAVAKQGQLANLALDSAINVKKQEFAKAAQTAAIMRQMGSGQNMSISPNSIPPEVYAGLDENSRKYVDNMRERWVDGYGPATNPDAMQAFQKKRGELEPGINGIQTVQKMLKDYSRITDPIKAAKIRTELEILVGSLREAVVGPGAMTPDEYKRLVRVIGDPTSLDKFRGLEEAKLGQVLKKLQRDLDASAEQFGLPRKNKNIELKTLGPAQ